MNGVNPLYRNSTVPISGINHVQDSSENIELNFEEPITFDDHLTYMSLDEMDDNIETLNSAPKNSVIKRVANGVSKAFTGFKGSEIAKGVKKTLKQHKTLPPIVAGLIKGGRLALFTVGAAIVIAGRAAGFIAAFSIAVACGALCLVKGVLKVAIKALIEIFKLPFRILNMIFKALKFLYKLLKNPNQAKQDLKNAVDSVKETIQSIKEFSPKETLKKIQESKAFEKHMEIMEYILAASIIGGVAVGGMISGIGINIVNFTVDMDLEKEELTEKVIKEATSSATCGAMAGVSCISLGSILYGQETENENPNLENLETT